MANDIAKFFGAHSLPDLSKHKEGLAALGAAKNTLAGKALLRLDKNTGKWMFGIDSTPFNPGVHLIANPFSLCTGYVAWWQGKIEGEVMQPISMGPVHEDRLGPVNSGGIPPGKKEPSGKGWEEQLSIELLTQTEIPLQLLYKVNSYGGKQALMTLAGEIAFAQDENPARIFPVIELSVGSYMREGSIVYTPHLNVVGWLGNDGNPVGETPKLERRPLV